MFHYLFPASFWCGSERHWPDLCIMKHVLTLRCTVILMLIVKLIQYTQQHETRPRWYVMSILLTSLWAACCPTFKKRLISCIGLQFACTETMEADFFTQESSTCSSVLGVNLKKIHLVSPSGIKKLICYMDYIEKVCSSYSLAKGKGDDLFHNNDWDWDWGFQTVVNWWAADNSQWITVTKTDCLWQIDGSHVFYPGLEQHQRKSDVIWNTLWLICFWRICFAFNTMCWNKALGSVWGWS